METWKDVDGYEGLYQVSNLGRMKSFYHDTAHGQIMKLLKRPDGYLQVVLYRDGKHKTVFVHRLVAEAFLGHAPSPKHEVNHKNGDKTDNRAENLEWVTSSENKKHAYRALGKQARHLKGEANGRSVLTARRVVEIRRLSDVGEHTQAELGEMFGISQFTIKKIVNRKRWQHVP